MILDCHLRMWAVQKYWEQINYTQYHVCFYIFINIYLTWIIVFLFFPSYLGSFLLIGLVLNLRSWFFFQVLIVQLHFSWYPCIQQESILLEWLSLWVPKLILEFLLWDNFYLNTRASCWRSKDYELWWLCPKQIRTTGMLQTYYSKSAALRQLFQVQQGLWWFRQHANWWNLVSFYHITGIITN